MRDPLPAPTARFHPVPYHPQLALRDTASIDLVVIHCTETPTLQSARSFGERILYPETGTGACGHYYIDRDGSILVYVEPERIAHHVRGFNPRSIGIELVNRGRYPHWHDSRQQTMDEDYPQAQIDALLGLLDELCANFPTLHWIAGHEDLDREWVAASDDPTLRIRRKLDPGPRFPWPVVLGHGRLRRLAGRSLYSPPVSGRVAMPPAVVADLIDLLKLERIEDNLYRGQSRDIGTRFVFGGQVMGQALSAAQATVEPDRQVHSLHAYFLRPGDIEAPILYSIDRTRDGRSFSTRRVTAIQHGQPICVFASSFHIEESGVEHQIGKPEVPAPEDLEPLSTPAPERLAKLPPMMQRWLSRQLPFEVRPVYPRDELRPPKRPPYQQVWFRLVEPVGEAPLLHRALLAYASDFHLLGTATLPHGISYHHPEVQMASIDHAMWFHRSFRCDDWLLYALDSPTAQGARGLARGLIYDRLGRLVASTAQEGMIRVRGGNPDA